MIYVLATLAIILSVRAIIIVIYHANGLGEELESKTLEAMTVRHFDNNDLSHDERCNNWAAEYRIFRSGLKWKWIRAIVHAIIAWYFVYFLGGFQ